MSKSPAFQFYAADYLADENVALMSLEEEGAYIRALAYCWREGSLPADDEKLSRLLKGCSMETIKTIKGCFKVGSNNPSRLVHLRLDCEREKQVEWKRKSSEAGKKSGKVRRANKLNTEPTLNQASDLVEPKTNSSFASSSSNKEQKQVPSRGKRESAKSSEAKYRHAEFKAIILRYWESKNGEDEMPWGPAEGRNLEMWLRESPHTTAEQFTKYLANRFRSEGVVHSDRPSRWIGDVTRYANGPLNQFKQPLNGNNSQQNIQILSRPEAINAH